MAISYDLFPLTYAEIDGFSPLKALNHGLLPRHYLHDSPERLIQAPRFIFFDIGIVSQLTRRGEIKEGSELFGNAFEHFILMEVTAYCSYFNRRYPLSYWRTASQLARQAPEGLMCI